MTFKFHLLFAVVYSFTIWSEIRNHENLSKLDYYKFKNLSFLNRYCIFITLLTLISNVFYYWFSVVTGYRRLRSFKSWFYTCVAFPLNAITFTMFWSLYLTNKNLVVNPKTMAMVPWWHNHLTHTMPGLTCILEIFLTRFKRQKGMTGLKTALAFVVAYSIYMIYIFKTMISFQIF